MSKSYYSLGLMSGTSMDGVDASIIQSDGEKKYKVILDKYFEYTQGIFKDLTKLRAKIKSSKDLKKFSNEIKKILNTSLMFFIFLSISFLVRIFLVSSLPEGSPINVVPPPSNTIG